MSGTSPDKEDLVLVGRFGAPHGVRGEIRIKSFTGDPEAIGTYSPLWNAECTHAFELTNVRHVKDDMLVARVKTIADRNAAEALTNLDLYADRTKFPAAEEDEFYHSDLIGLAAVTDAGETLGLVTRVLNFGAGDILEIAPAHGATLLLPFTKAVVPSVDVKEGKLTIVPPDEVEIKGEE